MTDPSTQQNAYDQWLARRREGRAPVDLPDRVMHQVIAWERQRSQVGWLLWLERVERRRAARWAVCGAALAVGSLPYLLLAHVPSF